MSHFSTALQAKIEANFSTRGGQTALAKQAGIEPASLSRYLNDVSRPDVEALEKICVVMDPAERVDVVIAYLRDEIPPSAQQLIRIVSLIESSRVAEEPPQRTPLPKKLRAAFDFLEEKASGDTLLQESILATYHLMRGKRI
jgi:transcriptional regulator with XRE-family HTH domain